MARPRKCSPSVESRIRELTQLGFPTPTIRERLFEELPDHLVPSERTIARISADMRIHQLARYGQTSPPSVAAPPADDTSAESSPPPSTEELDGFLTKLIVAQNQELERARSSGDTIAFQRASKSLIVSLALREKVKPKSDAPAGVFVTDDDIANAAKSAREKLHRVLAAVEHERSSWPQCPTCGQRTRPGDP